jgi:hypothetical protein
MWSGMSKSRIMHPVTRDVDAANPVSATKEKVCLFRSRKSQEVSESKPAFTAQEAIQS